MAVLVLALDRISKWAIVNYMDLYESIPLIEGWLHITSSRNRGAAFGILQGKTMFLVALTILVAIFIIYYIYRVHKTQKLFAFSLALILGGAIGNLIDRATTGAVVDFIDVRIINFAIFNVADSAIVIGTALILVDIFIFKNDQHFD